MIRVNTPRLFSGSIVDFRKEGLSNVIETVNLMKDIDTDERKLWCSGMRRGSVWKELCLGCGNVEVEKALICEEISLSFQGVHLPS
jgi:hypothetical protein